MKPPEGGPYRTTGKINDLPSPVRRDLNEGEKRAVELLRGLAERIEQHGCDCSLDCAETSESCTRVSSKKLETRVSLRITVIVPSAE